MNVSMRAPGRRIMANLILFFAWKTARSTRSGDTAQMAERALVAF